jgi:hypothetical protein
MTEAGGLVVAAIIAGAVTIIAAIIAALVSFLSLIISKEQSVSEFRQQWIDALQKDVAIVVGYVIAIHGESIAKHKDNQEELWARLKGTGLLILQTPRHGQRVATFARRD